MALIFTHTIAALVTLISLIAIFIGIKLYKRIGRIITSYEAISLTFIMLFVVTMLTAWMQNRLGSTTFLDITLRSLINSLNIDVKFALVSPPVESYISYGVELLNQGGYLILLVFAIIGALLYLQVKNYNKDRIILIFLAGMLLAPPNLFSIFNLVNILPERWYIFIYIPLSILAIAGLLSISNLIKSKTVNLFVIILVMLSIIFAMTTNSLANDDSPLFYNNAARSAYTQSELTAIRTLSYMGSGRPVTDIYYGEIFPYVIGSSKYTNMVRNENTIFIQRNYYLNNPEWNEKYRTVIHEGGIGNYKQKTAMMIFDYMKEHGIDKGLLFYNNGNVKAYAIKS